MDIKYVLTAYSSKRDMFGNTYWAFRFQYDTKRPAICGIVSGGESNIYGVLRNWNVKNG